MKQKLLNNFKLRATLLVAMLCAAFTGAWAQTDYSDDYTGNITLSTAGGTSASACKVVVGQTEYDGIKAGTGKIAGAVVVTVPEGTKYLHLHIAGWNNASVTIAVTPSGYSEDIVLTSNSGIANNSPFTFNGAANTDSYYKVITFAEALEEETALTFTATGGTRFVMWGVTAEDEGNPGDQSIVTTVAIDASGITNTNVYDGTDAGSLAATVTAGETEVEGATVTWSGNNDEVATINAETGAVTLVAAGSVTFTASYAGVQDQYKPSSKTYTMTVTNSDPNAPGSENNPYTVAEAVAFINTLGGTTSEEVYVSGIISQVDSYNSKYSSITYWISDDGTTEGQMEVYSGKGLGGAAFSAITDLAVGDIVTVKGNVKMYNTTPEFIQNNQLVSFDRPAVTTPTITANPSSLTGFTYVVDNGPSAAQKITISGSNLTASTTASLGDNSNFEFSFSEDGEYFDSNIGIDIDMTLSVYVRMKSGLAVGEYDGLITLTSVDAETVTVPLSGSVTAPEAPNMTWDLSTNSYDEVTDEDVVTWSSNYATMTNSSKGGGTKASNYLGGDANNRTSSRFYSGNSLTITPGLGYEITSIIFEATSANYASALASSTWTNASADANGTTVTVTPTDGSTDIFATIGGTCGFTSVKVYYQELSDYAPIWSTLPAPIVSVDELYEFYPSTYVSAMPAPTSITLETLAPSDSYDYQEGYFIFNYNTPGVYAFTFTATNPEGSSNATLTITVEAATVTPSITLPQYEYGVNADGGDAELPPTCNNLADEPQLTVMFFEADGTTPAQYDWISASINGNGNIAGHMEPNTGDARTAYFKVAGVDANQNWIYSDLVTINQEAYTGPSITMSESSIDFEIGGGSKTLSIESVSLGSNPSFDVQFFESDGVTPTECVWIYYQFDPNDNKVTITGIANDEGVARTAYFKVYTEVNKTLIYSNLVAVNQAGPVVDYATLPFSWSGGAKADLLALNGVTANSLGSDYAAGNAPYLVKFDGTGDYIQVKTDSRPGVVSVGVKMLGGAETSTITVQESADGKNFSDVEELTISGKQNDVLDLATTNAFAEDSRYVRLLFTKGSNVGVGPISISKPSNEPSITLEQYEYNLNIDGGDAVLPVTCTNLADDPKLAVVFVESDGETATTYEWITATINNEGNIAGHIDPNTGDARTAYFKVSGVDANNNAVYSELVTINQDAYTGPSITFEKSSIDLTAGGESDRKMSFEAIGFATAPTFEVVFFEQDGVTAANYGWVTTANIEGGKVNLSVEANDGEARTAYFKVHAIGTEIYSNLVTINQAAPVLDYATLPFSWDDTNTPNGITTSGVGTYKSSPYMKFDGSGDYIILKIDEVPGTLTFDVKGNTFSGGTFTVQTSADGVDYDDLETYTELDATQSETFKLASSVRYIKWVYTEKVTGNVALGNIVVTAPMNLNLNAYGYATYASEYALDFTTSEADGYSAWEITEINSSNETITFNQIKDKVAAGTGVLLMGDPSSEVTLTRTANGEALPGNKLVGITESKQVGDDQYFGLKGNEFVKVNTGVVPAGKALLPIDNLTAGVKSFTLIFNDADGIQTIETVSAEKAQAIFNLAGQRLPKAQKGINIINGKKVLVK